MGGIVEEDPMGVPGTTTPAGVALKDVSHVSIAVSDMERSIAFYRDVFGWQQLFDEHMGGENFERLTGAPGAAGRACGGRIGSLRVELMDFNFLPKGAPGTGLGLRVLSMEVEDAAAAHAALVAKGVPVSGEPVEVHGVKMFFAIDPDGQGIEMCEYVPGGPAWGGEYA
jgi:catechol 2,3-dioxygenase-like lactoylglutathione lyase family enzyme